MLRLITLPRVLALVAVMLVAQATAASHLDLDDTHPAGESCGLCAGLGVFGAANVGAALTLPPPIAGAAIEQFHATAPPAVRFIRLSIRGPPAAA
jgi:hypothetical protein